MRRALLLVGLVALVAAGCGSSSKSPAASPLQTELSYYPSSAPLVLRVMTDPHSTAVKNLQGLMKRFPIATFGLSAISAKLDQMGIDYQSDVKPLLGNPLVLGASGPTLSHAGAGNSYLAVWMTKDASKLSSLIPKLGLHKSGMHDGAILYQSGGTTTVAVDDATLLLAPSTTAVDTALDRHANGGGITTAQYQKAFAGLPQDSLIQAFGSLARVLSKPSATRAGQVPWVAAIKGYAVSVSAGSSGLSMRYRLDTSGRPLSDHQVPLATGSSPPNLVNALPIAVGAQNPSHIFSFVEAVEQTTNAAKWARFEKRQARIKAKTGVDLESLVKLATGSLIVASDTRTTMGRAEVSDPAQAKRTLSRLITLPSAVLGKATRVNKLSGGFYAIKHAHGTTITIGVVGNQLVAGKATPARLRAFAAAPTSQAAGAQGSLAFRIGLAQVLQLTMKQPTSKLAQSVLSSLGDITGWAAASNSQLTGSASLAVH